MIKKSRQREAIQRCLMDCQDHPTAETVYLRIKDELPNVSLGTVYRNLSLLSDMGEVRRITAGGGPDRFDGNMEPHFHFMCRSCGCVMDINIPPQDNLNMLAAEDFDGRIEAHTIRFTGLCPSCLQNKSI